MDNDKTTEDLLIFKDIILSTQLETSLDGILVVDENGKIISHNQRFVDMWGIPPDVIESKSDERALQSVMDKLTEPEEFLNKVKYLYKNINEKSEDDIFLKDGRIFDRYSAPMFGEKEKYYGRVWYFRDVTEQRKVTEITKEKNEELERANKLMTGRELKIIELKEEIAKLKKQTGG